MSRPYDTVTGTSRGFVRDGRRRCREYRVSFIGVV